jgi:hypothetical protein
MGHSWYGLSATIQDLLFRSRHFSKARAYELKDKQAMLSEKGTGCKTPKNQLQQPKSAGSEIEDY